MDQILRKEVPLDIGTLDLQVTFKFVPNGSNAGDVMPRSNPITLTSPPLSSSTPATEKQKQALDSMARRLGRQIDLEKLSKSEASNLIDELGAELRRR